MNFWNHLESKKIIDREQIEKHLTKKLGQPQNEIQVNLLGEIIKKINSYYAEPEEQNYTTYSLVGWVNEISERKYKEGKNKGQTYYALKLGGAGKEILQARKELLDEAKWEQVKSLAILGKNLVFSYRKWITNKQVLDFYSPEKRK